MFTTSWSMANRLFAIQYTPRAAGSVKQIHRENRGMMSMVVLVDWSMGLAVPSTSALILLVTIMDTTPSRAEMIGMSQRTKAEPTLSAFQNIKLGVWDRFTPRKVKSIWGIPARSGTAATILSWFRNTSWAICSCWFL